MLSDLADGLHDALLARLVGLGRLAQAQMPEGEDSRSRRAGWPGP